ncbi:hypothetical protein SUGI_0979760 [Cryptomeria japonica]|uniref:uncharacterized protein LOC131038659 isoform X2 n=1 Tax=Cryptomeria japonica TaxID=3369 RepID=UPI0024148F69|nr:uncharacterized protein LOC131038659 isoform X2 [Cryptomeria japonica]GLJ46492.1 hypothetical protein SUGI_0979760 [Cryptomeria japonica]
MAKNPIDGVLKAGSDAILQRRILFHPARNKRDSGRGTSTGFYLEPLNPQLECSPTSRIENPSAQETAKPPEKEDLMDLEVIEEIGFRRIGAGLANLGNTCFLNSVLQCLTYTQPLAAYFQGGRHKLTCRVAGFCAMCAVQDHAINAAGSSGKILSPTILVRNLRCISRNFRISRQEDAHEYMMNLMESMHKCCLPAGVTSESPVAYEKSLVHKIFGGRLISQVKCTQCSYCSDKFDPFLDLSLEIIRADSLLKALSHYTAVEQLDGGMKRYQCDRCKVKVKALKQLKIDKAPHVLAIHLKRFSVGGSGGKIDKKVDFGCTLDLKPFVSSSHEGNFKYTLYGVLVHDGWSTHSGHYFCFIRSSTGIWHALDDNRVYSVSEKSVLSQKAYMLFYIRDKNMSIKTAGGSQSQDNGSKLKKIVPLNIGRPKENQLQDSCASQATANVPSFQMTAISSIIAGVNKKSKVSQQVGNVSNVNFNSESLEKNTSSGQLCSKSGSPADHDATLQIVPPRTDGIQTNDVFSSHTISNGCTSNDAGNNIKKHESEIKGADSMDNFNEILVVRHSRNHEVSNGNGNYISRNSGVDSKINGNSHENFKHSMNDLTGIITGHHTAKVPQNNSNGKLVAGEHLENCSVVHNSIDNESEAAKLLLLEDGSLFQGAENGTFLCKEREKNGSSVKSIHQDRFSKCIQETKCVSNHKYKKSHKDNHYLISRNRLKLMKHLPCPQFLRTLSFRRHFLLRAMHILRKKRSNERKNCKKLRLKKAGVFLKQKHSANMPSAKDHAVAKSSGCSVASKSPQQFRGKGLSNKVNGCVSVQHAETSEITVGVAQNGCNIAKFGDTSMPLGNGQLSSGNNTKLKKQREVADGQGLIKARHKYSDVEPDSKFNKDKNLSALRQSNNSFRDGVESCQQDGALSMENCESSVHLRSAVDVFSVGSGLSKEKNISAFRQPNSSFTDGGETCQQDPPQSAKKSESSFLEARLDGPAVPCWDVIDDGLVKSSRASDKQANHVGYVLDEWDEEYDRGRRKKVKQAQYEDGIGDSYGKYSNGQRNPFQSLSNRKAKIAGKGNSFMKTNQGKLQHNGS